MADKLHNLGVHEVPPPYKPPVAPETLKATAPKAYVYDLLTHAPEGSQPKPDSWQSSPSFVVAVFPFMYPSSFAFRNEDRSFVEKSEGDRTALDRKQAMALRRNPIFLDHLSTSVQVISSKRNHVAGAAVQLIEQENSVWGDISPGDWIFIWMVNSHEAATNLRERIKRREPCNEFKDGIKFVGKVTSVGEDGQISAGDGKAHRGASILAQAYSELDTNIYFDSFTTPMDQFGFMFQEKLGISIHKGYCGSPKEWCASSWPCSLGWESGVTSRTWAKRRNTWLRQTSLSTSPPR
jgi:hypothetical protein